MKQSQWLSSATSCRAYSLSQSSTHFQNMKCRLQEFLAAAGVYPRHMPLKTICNDWGITTKVCIPNTWYMYHWDGLIKYKRNILHLQPHHAVTKKITKLISSALSNINLYRLFILFHYSVMECIFHYSVTEWCLTATKCPTTQSMYHKNTYL